MLLGLLPVAASAVNLDTIEFSIPMRKTVETMAGATPVEGTYDFVLNDIDDAGVSVHANTASVTTDRTAAWDMTGEIIKDEITDENNWISMDANGTYRQMFPLTEARGAVPGCRYSDQIYNVMITVNKETGKADVKLYIYGEDTLVQEADFINTFEPTGYDSLPRVFTDVGSSHWAFWNVMEAANGHDYTKSGSAET